MSGMEIELFEANQKEMQLLESFREEILDYLGDFVPVKCQGTTAA
jgi:hypothetical protein